MLTVYREKVEAITRDKWKRKIIRVFLWGVENEHSKEQECDSEEKRSVVQSTLLIYYLPTSSQVTKMWVITAKDKNRIQACETKFLRNQR